MIYVLKSLAYSEKDESKHIELIKIGYTENKDKRFSAYRLYNPSIKVLFIIPDATEEQEHWLHKYFKRFRYQSYGHEWFYYDEEIIDFFNTHKTKNSLGSVGLNGPRYIKRSELNKITDQLVRILYNTGRIKEQESITKSEFLVDQIYNELNNPSEFDSIYDWIYKNYSIKKEDLIEDTNLKEFYKIVNAKDRIKYIYKNHKTINFEKVPAEYKIYYETLGLERIKALGYQKSKLDNELEDKYNSENVELKEELYKTFLVGEKYLLTDIKTTLDGLYKKYNITKSIKATDLNDFFNIKSCKISDIVTKKQSRGFKIVNKKC